jgi:hypothetical protein
MAYNVYYKSKKVIIKYCIFYYFQLLLSDEMKFRPIIYDTLIIYKFI